MNVTGTATWSHFQNGRTHEPALRELVAQIDGMVVLHQERDQRYEDRFKAQEQAVAAALTASDKLIAAAFAACTWRRGVSWVTVRTSLVCTVAPPPT